MMMKKEIEVGSYVKHKLGFEGIVIETDCSDITVFITKGFNPVVPNKRTYVALPEYLTVIEPPANETETGHDYEVNLEMNGMDINMDFTHFIQFIEYLGAKK